MSSLKEIVEFFAKNGIAFFWELHCGDCKTHSSVLADIKFDMSYEGQDILNLIPKSGFICDKCHNKYEIRGVKMWTHHGSFTTKFSNIENVIHK